MRIEVNEYEDKLKVAVVGNSLETSPEDAVFIDPYQNVFEADRDVRFAIADVLDDLSDRLRGERPGDVPVEDASAPVTTEGDATTTSPEDTTTEATEGAQESTDPSEDTPAPVIVTDVDAANAVEAAKEAVEDAVADGTVTTEEKGEVLSKTSAAAKAKRATTPKK